MLHPVHQFHRRNRLSTHLLEENVYYYSQTCIKEPPFGKPKFGVINRWLSHQGSGRRLVMEKLFIQYDL